MVDLAELTHDIEYQFLRGILTRIKEKSMTEEQAQPIAQAFLALKPFSSIEEAHQKISLFAQNYPDFNYLTDFTQAYQQEAENKKIVEKMRELIHSKDLESALALIPKD